MLVKIGSKVGERPCEKVFTFTLLQIINWFAISSAGTPDQRGDQTSVIRL